MGCSHSHLCVSTISQQPAEPSQTSSNSPAHGSRAGVRHFTPDPTKAAEAARLRAGAVAAAEQLLTANKGVNFRDTYVRATLVSYGGSCRVFTAVNKHTNRSVAIKTIAKVRMQLPWFSASDHNQLLALYDNLRLMLSNSSLINHACLWCLVANKPSNSR